MHLLLLISDKAMHHKEISWVLISCQHLPWFQLIYHHTAKFRYKHTMTKQSRCWYRPEMHCRTTQFKPNR